MLEENLALILIIIGLSNIGAIIYFRIIINKTIYTLSDIVALNKNLGYDLEEFLDKIDIYLHKLNIKAFGYEVLYLGDIIKQKTVSNPTIIEQIQTDEYTIKLYFVPVRYRGENKAKINIAVTMLKLIIKTNLLIKTETINQSFLNLSKFNTFLMHDIKNISQFFQTLQYNIDNCKSDDDRKKFIEYMKVSSQLLNTKTTNITKILEQNSQEWVGNDMTSISVRDLIQSLVTMYSLEVYIKGNATIVSNLTVLHMIIENLIKNIKDKQQKEPNIHAIIEISEKKNNIVIKFFDSGSPISDTYKIFQPFFTTKSTGLGIGLYKAKKLSFDINANLEAKNLPSGVEFTLEIFKNNH